jgi:hypothetical protein
MWPMLQAGQNQPDRQHLQKVCGCIQTRPQALGVQTPETSCQRRALDYRAARQVWGACRGAPRADAFVPPAASPT